ncbi:MAG TPA: SMC-Scp complex subunit ScpB [Bryobacteraceae bacterium]|jgi:segregation and condensation protein B
MSQSENEQPVESPEEQVDAQAEPLPEVEEQAEEQPEMLPSDETVAVSFSAEEILGAEEPAESEAPAVEDATLRATLEAIIYVTDEPLTVDQIAEAIEQPRERVVLLLEQLCAEYDKPERGLSVREIAGGFRMTTKAEHHDAVRRFVRNLNPPMKLSLPALETLAVIAYKQPITSPEIMEIRGVQGAGVLKTLLDRKLIAPAGRKQVIGKPILYKTTKEFLVQFGLKNLNELPTLKEFQDIGSLSGGEPDAPVQANLIEMPAPPEEEGEAQEAEASEEPEPRAETEESASESNPTDVAEPETE